MAGKVVPISPEKGFTPEQIKQLLKPINQSRVLSDGKGFSHVSQQDILAHLTRIFGFGNFDIEVKNVELVFETPRDESGKRFDVCYKALVRLTIRDPQGREVCHYENGSMETAQNQSRGDGHDLAYKSAISLSVKRAAIALGDQFGLSLYNKGQMSALVRSTLVGAPTEAPEDIQEGVPQQVSLGNDEKEALSEEVVTYKAPETAPVVTLEPPASLAPEEGAPTLEIPAKTASEGLLKTSYAIIQVATTLDQLRNMWTQSKNHLDQLFEAEPGKFVTLKMAIDEARARIGAAK